MLRKDLVAARQLIAELERLRDSLQVSRTALCTSSYKYGVT